MWPKQIEPEKDYALQLCQDDKGSRYAKIRSILEEKDESLIIESSVIPHHILSSRSSKKLEEHCKIFFGGHGEWFTSSEGKSMIDYDNGVSKSIVWVTESAPCFALK